MDPFNSRYIRNEKRWLWIDYDKGISILLVGYGHCLDTLEGHGLNLEGYPFFNYIGTFLYGFRMPMFFIVSGLLVARSLNKKGLGGYVGDRTNNILYPLMVWGIIETTLQLVMGKVTHNTVSPMNYLNLIINPRDTGHFWYLNALFCIGVIYALLRTVLKLKPYMQLIFGAVLYSISAYIYKYHIPVGLFADICEYYIFFALGDVITKVMLDENNIKKFASWVYFFPLMAAFIGVQYYFTQFNIKITPDGRSYVEHQMPFIFFFEALLGCIMSVNISFLLQRYQKLAFLRIVGYHSLFIYCVQIIFMTISRFVFVNGLHITYVPALIPLVWASGTILPIFFYNFCLRYGMWWLYTYRKPAKAVEYLKKNNIFSFGFRKREAIYVSAEKPAGHEKVVKIEEARAL